MPDVTMLDLVEITEKLPLLEQKADKLIVNVEGNVTNTGGSLLDVMKKVPGMIVINDRLGMAGSGSPTILINGKSTQYMDIQSLLSDMPGDNIKTVEIIH
jgi:nitrate reductase NapAB chaperone NapD